MGFLDSRSVEFMQAFFSERVGLQLNTDDDLMSVVSQEIGKCRKDIVNVSDKLSSMVFADDVPDGMTVLAALVASRDSLIKQLNEARLEFSDPKIVANVIGKYHALVANAFSTYARSILKTIITRGSSNVQTKIPLIKMLSSLINELSNLVVDLLLNDGPAVTTLRGLVDYIRKLFIIEFFVKVNITAVRGILYASTNNGEYEHISGCVEISFSDSGRISDISDLYKSSRSIIRAAVQYDVDCLVDEIKGLTDFTESGLRLRIDFETAKFLTKKQKESIKLSCNSLSQRLDDEMRRPSAGLRTCPRKLLALVAEYYCNRISVSIQKLKIWIYKTMFNSVTSK